MITKPVRPSRRVSVMRQKEKNPQQSRVEQRWIVALTERYEVAVSAKSRSAAIDSVFEWGGCNPVRSKVSARLARKDEAYRFL